MTSYLLIDSANCFFRARHVAHRGSSAEEKVAFAMHVTLASVNKAWRDQKADHVVFCFEGRSWRKDFYEPYKKNRSVARAAQTESEAEEDKMFWAAFDAIKTFISERTNCTVLQNPILEADDCIGGWIQSHPDDDHTIVSSDTDFYQLLADNVKQYNGITDELHTIDGIFDKRGKPVIDKKTKLPKKIPDPKFILFEKCVRGDPTDNVFSAYPGVRTKGTKNKTGIEEAYADMHKKGFAWNNMMLQKWVDHNEVEHRVLDDYNRNCTLVDLTAQPDHVKVVMAETIAAGSVSLNRPMIGAQFLKFCGKFELTKLSEQAQIYADLFSSGYPEAA